MQIHSSRGPLGSRRRRKVAVVGLSLAAVAALLAGCSGSASSGGSASSDPAQVEAAKAATASAKEPITTIGVTEPLKAKPTPGKTFVWLECEIPVCKEQRDNAEKAVIAAGWQFKALGYSLADPATQVSALQQALQFDPVAVGTVSLQKAQFDAVIPAYEKAGAVIVNAYGNAAPTGPIITNFDGADFSKSNGQKLSNWLNADSNGSGKALVVTVDAVQALKEMNTEIVNYTEANCPGCQLTELKMNYPDIAGGKLPASVVGALQRDSSLEYVILPQGDFAAGLPAALAAAGLTGKIKVAGQGAGVQNLAGIQSGSESAWLQTNNAIVAWNSVDAALRHDQGMTVAPGVNSPVQLLTKDVPFEIAASLPAPADFAAQYEKLWLVN